MYDLLIRGGTLLDASGLLVTPGWVDIHTQYDGQATRICSLNLPLKSNRPGISSLPSARRCVTRLCAGLDMTAP